MLMFEMVKISNESKDIQANFLKRIKILENDFQLSQAQSFDFELKLRHQKEQTSCDISWKSKMAKLNDENVSLHIQVESLVQERKKVKLEYQKLLNSIKMTRVQHQQEVNELIESVNQKTYAYGDVRAKNQDLLLKISELKAKIKNDKTKKNVNTKVDVTSDKSKPVTSCSTPKNDHGQKKNANVIAGEMYKVIKIDTRTLVAKANMFSCNFIGVASSSIVRRLESKDTNSKKKVLLDVKRSQSKVAKLFTPPFKFVSCDAYDPDCSGHSKHMTKNLKLLRNFVEKFMGTIRFGNNYFPAIAGYGDYVQGNLMICHVYYVEGLRHNLFSVRQFCDGDLKVAFRSNTFYVWNFKGEDLLTGSCNFNLYTISISEMVASSPVCLISKVKSTKSWLWHIRLSHLNFSTINYLTKHDLVDGLLRFKYYKDHLCLACEQGKSKKATFLPKLIPRPGLKYSNFEDSTKELNEMPSKEDLDNLFGPLYKEYYTMRTPKVSYNSTTNTLDNEDTRSSIIVEDHDAP
nr:integrase, catalytic region, zinc finger, CCHC-type, peptidase aspartic, catalytic [Tanacetum cinerariifolium]